MIELRLPTAADKDDVLAFRDECLGDTRHIPGASNLENYDEYAQWLDACNALQRGVSEKNYVPADQYLAYDSESQRLVGMIQLRHSLNDYLRDYGGHIGYTVRPTERRKGYGGQIVRACLNKARLLGLSRALITCDDTNLASEALIRKCGGIYDDTRIDSSGIPKKRFWITLN